MELSSVIKQRINEVVRLYNMDIINMSQLADKIETYVEDDKPVAERIMVYALQYGIDWEEYYDDYVDMIKELDEMDEFGF